VNVHGSDKSISVLKPNLLTAWKVDRIKEIVQSGCPFDSIKCRMKYDAMKNPGFVVFEMKDLIYNHYWRNDGFTIF
jgi:hypothetical protein